MLEPLGRVHRRLLPLTVFLLASACSAGQAPAGDADASAGDARAPCFGCVDAAALDASVGTRAEALFLTTCNGSEGCHGSNAAGLSFPASDPLANVVGVRANERPDLFRVAPGDPLSSYLYLKVRGDGGIDGDRMPAGEPYDPRIPEMVFAWIEAGAPPP